MVFDTFFGGYVPLSSADAELIEGLRDAIAPIYNPVYEGPEGGAWLNSDYDLVIGYEADDGSAYAYPVRMLNFHEVVNDIIDGKPVLITYCPLCASGIVFSRVVDRRVLKFGNTSALYESSLVMYDHETGSYWFQVGGEAIVGELTGTRLELLPSQTTTWGEWLVLHADTRVLSRKQGIGTDDFDFGSSFEGLYGERVSRGAFAVPVSPDKVEKAKTQLGLAHRVLVVQVGDAQRAYPLADVRGNVINDTLGGEPIVIVSGQRRSTGAAFSRRVSGRTLRFEIQDAAIRDQETATSWDGSGRAIAGQLEGSRLKALASKHAFWFAVAVADPDLELYQS